MPTSQNFNTLVSWLLRGLVIATYSSIFYFLFFI